MDARTYAKVVGVVVLLVGVIGLIIGDPEGGLLGFNVDITEDIIHLGSGGLLTYLGFKGGAEQTRSVVMVLGVVYLLVGILGFVLPELFGLLPTDLDLQDNILHLVLGGLGIWAAKGGAATTTNTGTAL